MGAHTRNEVTEICDCYQIRFQTMTSFQIPPRYILRKLSYWLHLNGNTSDTLG